MTHRRKESRLRPIGEFSFSLRFIKFAFNIFTLGDILYCSFEFAKFSIRAVNRLADFLNIGINEYPGSQETADALLVYADEAILVADDMVAKSGDYKKAIDHLSTAEGYFNAAGLTPYHPLVAKIAELDDWRFITQERFDEVKKGMTKEAVVAAVGQVYFRNIQESQSKGVESWLYKKREGGAAAFYFKIKNGKVYDKNWEAVAVTTVVE